MMIFFRPQQFPNLAVLLELFTDVNTVSRKIQDDFVLAVHKQVQEDMALFWGDGDSG